MNGLKMHHLHPFFKNFLGETRPPPYCESIKNSPLLAVYDPLQPSWKFSRNTYFEDRSFEGKNYIQFCGKKSTRTRQKMGSECTICIHFSKIFPGEAPRTPTCRRGSPPPAPSPCGASRRFGYAPPAVDPLDPPLLTPTLSRRPRRYLILPRRYTCWCMVYAILGVFTHYRCIHVQVGISDHRELID